MPWSGSGNYTRIHNWQADASAGTKIKADRHDAEDDAFASGISNCIAKDGQSSPTADIPFNAKKITGLADPVNDQDAVTKKYMLGGAATQGLWTKLGFTSADMSILGRTADGGATPPTKQRIAYNDKADGSGNDVFVVNDDGTMSARAADGTYKLYATATAETRSRLVNGAMQISQENGNTVSTIIATLNYNAADQFVTISSTSPGTAATVRAQSVTPKGSKDRIRIAISTVKGSLAAGDFLLFQQPIEGGRIADFQWGTASAKQVILRFGWRGPAGTYSIVIQNAAISRSYVASFTITAGQANTDTEQTIVIPGDTTGTWGTDTGIGLVLRFIVAIGTTYHGVAGWQAGNFWGTSANFNGMSQSANAYELFDVGLYLDPLATGVAPPWQMPDEAEELRACMRYWNRLEIVMEAPATTQTVYLPVELRSLPAVSGTAPGFSVQVNGTRTLLLNTSSRVWDGVVFNARM